MLKPLGSRVVVKRLEPGETSKGGIVLPDTAKEKPREGYVMAVGRGHVLDDGRTKALEVKVGDRVIFASYSGVEVKVDGEELLILESSDLLSVVLEGK